MPRTSSDDGDAPDRDRIRAINRQVVERLLAEPEQPLVEGGYALRVLQTAGRRTGAIRRAPLGAAVLAGQCYVVSPDPGRDWARNLAANSECLLLAGRRRDPRRAVAVHGDEAATVVATYLSAMQTTVPMAARAFPVAADAPPDEIAGHLDSIAVFRLDPDGDHEDGR